MSAWPGSWAQTGPISHPPLPSGPSPAEFQRPPPTTQAPTERLETAGGGGVGGGDSRPHWCVVGGAKVEELGGARPKGLVTRRRIERKGNLKRSLCIFLSLAKISLIAAQRPIFPLTILFSRLKELSYFGPGVQFSALTSLKFILEPLSLRVYDNKKTTT